MTLRDQIEARTNAANTSAVWKYLKRSERETQTSLQAQNTDSERLLSAASHVSDEKRKGWLLLVTVMIEIVKWLKGLVNKLQNVVFSKTGTNCMQVIQTVLHELAAPGFKVQSAETLLFIICSFFLCDNVIRVTNIFPN